MMEVFPPSFFVTIISRADKDSGSVIFISALFHLFILQLLQLLACRLYSHQVEGEKYCGERMPIFFLKVHRFCSHAVHQMLFTFCPLDADIPICKEGCEMQFLLLWPCVQLKLQRKRRKDIGEQQQSLPGGYFNHSSQRRPLLERDS